MTEHERAPMPEDDATLSRKAEYCTYCGGPVRHVCEDCGDEFYNMCTQMRLSARRYGPEIRRLKAERDALRNVLEKILALELDVKLLVPTEAWRKDIEDVCAWITRVRDMAGAALEPKGSERND